MEKRKYASRERRLMMRLNRRKRAFTERVPIWRLFRVDVLDFARSFLAFWAIVRILDKYF